MKSDLESKTKQNKQANKHETLNETWQQVPIQARSTKQRTQRTVADKLSLLINYQNTFDKK